ncbi:hypothetical protein MJA45_25855 [Paenibacillus aurantius]|uniref:Uncharacterized protein n=1 Tax=Paenibacillus aurantius TaxID=2918900 RepID=A0AA96LC53_9BACL|nr:hypothetical protein [Paenibacillus aurantius]WNQ11002.1 hypothetical protein MJA45_25855 [Paenibacillus aurantius]
MNGMKEVTVKLDLPALESSSDTILHEITGNSPYDSHSVFEPDRIKCQARSVSAERVWAAPVIQFMQLSPLLAFECTMAMTTGQG